MQCKNCGGKDFQKSTYNYYICNTCGNIIYDEKFSPKKKNSFGELYLLLIIGTAIMIITILILLFATASSKKNGLLPKSKIFYADFAFTSRYIIQS